MHTHINIDSMLEFHGNENTVREMYQLFKVELTCVRSQILKLCQEKNIISLYDTVHKLHGGCCYCHAPKLQKTASTLEKQLKLGEPLNPSQETQLLNRIDMVINELTEYLTHEAKQ